MEACTAEIMAGSAPARPRRVPSEEFAHQQPKSSHRHANIDARNTIEVTRPQMLFVE